MIITSQNHKYEQSMRFIYNRIDFCIFIRIAYIDVLTARTPFEGQRSCACTQYNSMYYHYRSRGKWQREVPRNPLKLLLLTPKRRYLLVQDLLYSCVCKLAII